MKGLIFQVRTDTIGQYRARVNGFALNGRAMTALLDGSGAERKNGDQFVLRNLNRPDIRFSPVERRFLLIYRRLFVNLAAYYLKGEPDRASAIRTLGRMEELIPSDVHPPAYWFSAAVADLYAKAGDLERARDFAERAIAAADRLGEEWRDDPIARRYNPHQISARMLTLLQRYDEAIERYHTLQRDGQADATVRGLIEELRVRRYLDLDDTARAIQELNTIIAEYGDPVGEGLKRNLGAWKELLEDLEQ
jgi:tetratricopeptide (TPR) repeat protein